MRAGWIGAGAGCCALFAAGAARADGGAFPTIERLSFSPTDPDVVVAAATYGVLLSRDHGRTWSYLCPAALGIPPLADAFPKLEITAAGALLATTSPFPSAGGLDRSTDFGCNWSCASTAFLLSEFDVAVRPDAPHSAVALVAPEVVTDGGRLPMQLLQSADDGATWSALGAPIDATAFGTEVAVAPSDPQRLYVAAVRGFAPTRTASVFASTDGGARWVEHTIPWFDGGSENSIGIAAVDPADPNRVYLTSTATLGGGGGTTAIYLTTDGAASFAAMATFSVPSSGPAFPGERAALALSRDGSKIYAGTTQDGFFVGLRGDTTLRKTSKLGVSCLATHGAELWACSQVFSSAPIGPSFVVGVSTDDGATFVPKLPQHVSVSGPLACAPNPGGAVACNAQQNGAACFDDFVNFCNAFSSPTATCGDGGTPDAGVQGGAEGGAGDAGRATVPGGATRAGCSCSTSQRDGGASAAALALLGIGAPVARRVARRRRSA